MVTPFQLTIDCAEPALQVEFWATALGYEVQPPPGGFDSWNAYWRSVGVPEDELDADRDAADSLVDPGGVGPRIWFQPVPEPKTVKNRLHLDLHVGGGREVPLEERRRRVEAEVARLVKAGATRLPHAGAGRPRPLRRHPARPRGQRVLRRLSPAQRSEAGSSRASQTARHTFLVDSPRASASSTVHPPRSDSTCSRDQVWA